MWGWVNASKGGDFCLYLQKGRVYASCRPRKAWEASEAEGRNEERKIFKVSTQMLPTPCVVYMTHAFGFFSKYRQKVGGF